MTFYKFIKQKNENDKSLLPLGLADKIWKSETIAHNQKNGLKERESENRKDLDWTKIGKQQLCDRQPNLSV